MRVRYYGHVGLQTGYGVAAAEMCMAILQAGIDLEISTNGTQLPARYLPLASYIRATEDLTPLPDAIIVHTLPLDCATVLASVSTADRTKALCVAYTTWEGAGTPPASFQSLRAFDRVWVPCRQNREWFEWGRVLAGKEALLHIREVPHPFDETVVEPPRAPFQNDGPYRFYTIGSWTARKNPEGVVRAFLREFTNADPVQLHIQATGAPADAVMRVKIESGIDPTQMPAIFFSNSAVSDEVIAAAHRACHCFVSATRGEAWNLPVFDAMLAGNHIIVPAETGSDDFLDRTNAQRYDSWLAPAGGEIISSPEGGVAYRGTQGLTIRSEWREPSIMDLCRLMRLTYLNRITRLEVDRDYINRTFGRAAVGVRIRNEIEKGLKT